MASSKINTTLILECFRFQLGMIVEELARHTPTPDSIPHGERILWARARGSLRAASKHLQNLTDTFHPPVESAAKRARNERSIERLRRWREEKRRDSEAVLAGSAEAREEAK